MNQSSNNNPINSESTIVIDSNTATKRFDGIGAVSGGGATSVLLKDYPEKQRNQILDLLFKPNFGASMSSLLVEVPGDCNSTQGAEPSHMHNRDDLNYHRGYEWWIMSEAKKRNPDITLDACAWGAPGWIGNGNFWSQDMCDYYVNWIKGLKSVYGLDLDAIGCRNEKGDNIQFPKIFRKTLNANGLHNVKLHAFDNWGEHKFDWLSKVLEDEELRESVDIIGNHTMSEIPASEEVQQIAHSLNKPIWNTEDHVYKKGFDCEISIVNCFNDNCIRSGATKIINWYLVAAVYPIEPYGEDPAAMVAASPWSGHYRIREAIWGYAHYGQFSKVGWNYVDSACGNLNDSGTYVTLMSPEPQKDFSIIIETKDASATQKLTFQIGKDLPANKLCVWRSNEKEQFIRLEDIAPENGCFTIEAEPNTVYSISTTTGQQKGSFADVPNEVKFPFPYYETFDSYSSAQEYGYLPRYTADIVGIFEIADRPDNKGKCMRQIIDQKALTWGPEWMPYTIIGDENWENYEVSADILLEGDGFAGVMGRISFVGHGWGTVPKGYYLRLTKDGACSINVISGFDGPIQVGDKENQELMKRLGDQKERPEMQLVSGSIVNFNAGNWHNVKLRFSGYNITGFVDGNEVLTTINDFYSHGMAGFLTGDKDCRYTAYFDNLLINEVNGEIPKPTVFSAQQTPIYK